MHHPYLRLVQSSSYPPIKGLSTLTHNSLLMSLPDTLDIISPMAATATATHPAARTLEFDFMLCFPFSCLCLLFHLFAFSKASNRQEPPKARLLRTAGLSLSPPGTPAVCQSYVAWLPFRRVLRHLLTTIGRSC